MSNKLLDLLKMQLDKQLVLEIACFKVKTEDVLSKLNEAEKEQFTEYTNYLTDMINRILEESIVKVYNCVMNVAVDTIVKKTA